jgi:1,2-dihydroxy-3-keto-5-methylthiopentene dioxygenase
MTALFIHRDDQAGSLDRPIVHPVRITIELAKIGVHFTQWFADQALAAGATQDAILEAYAEQVGRLRAVQGYQSADVVRIARGTPDTAPARAKFLSEHRHAEDEVRFFVEGSGSFYLHAEGQVFQLLCEQNDLLGVPAGIRHWFDMGTSPHFCAIRLFTNPTGWVAEFTGDTIATRYPTHDDAVARLARP